MTEGLCLQDSRDRRRSTAASQEGGIGFNPGPTWTIIEHADLV
jgi:hypothetical protein